MIQLRHSVKILTQRKRREGANKNYEGSEIIYRTAFPGVDLEQYLLF